MNKMDDASPSLRQSLQEEEKMFGWLRANAPAMLQSYGVRLKDHCLLLLLPKSKLQQEI
jgi:hypothetical protein